MTSANLPINLETTPLFKDYLSNVKKQLVKTKQNSETKRQGTRLQVARKSTNLIPNNWLCYTKSDSTAKSPTPVISEATGNSKSILSSNCERENGKENEPDGKNGEKERARSDGTNSPVDDDHDIQATSDSQLDNQHSLKDVTDGEEKEKEEEKGNQEENEDLCKQSSKVTNVKKQLQEGRNFRAQELQELYKFEPDTREERPILNVPKDRLLADLIVSHKDLIVKDHEHDSLLENRPEEDLTEDERKSPWNEYEQEKDEENYCKANNKKSVNLAANPIFTMDDYYREMRKMQSRIKAISEWEEKFKKGEINIHNSLFLASAYAVANASKTIDTNNVPLIEID